MKIKKYVDYFQFIRKNWNLKLALFTCYHELRGEKKYHLNTTYTNDLRQLEITDGNKENAFIYQPVNYFMLETALEFLKEQKMEGYSTNFRRRVETPAYNTRYRLVSPPTCNNTRGEIRLLSDLGCTQMEGALVDFGCGMGRILTVAAHYGFKEISGIEFSQELCDEARKNINEVRNHFPDILFNIYCENAAGYRIKKQEVIFTFFNPFDEVVMLPVVKNILRSFKEYPREITIVYFNPTEKEIFLSAGFREVWYYKKMEYLDFSILRLEPQSF